MRRSVTRLAVATVLLLAGCSGLLLRPDTPVPTTNLPAGVEVAAGQLASGTGCRLDYRTFVHAVSASAPGADADGDWIILAHGFLRSQQRMQGLAAAMAAAGMQVATLDFCNQKPWAGRHVQNGRDMVALARHLAARRVVYAGFSAGGLAAVLAGQSDRQAVGVLTLDLVETQGLGVRAVRSLNKPLLGLAGEPTNCNALDNARAVFAASRRARVQRIPGAGHCDFEAPTDGLCELVCADPDGPEQVHRARVIARAVAAAGALLDGNAAAWTTPAGTADGIAVNRSAQSPARPMRRQQIGLHAGTPEQGQQRLRVRRQAHQHHRQPHQRQGAGPGAQAHGLERRAEGALHLPPQQVDAGDLVQHQVRDIAQQHEARHQPGQGGI
jgi:dienelactone hydrolase